MVGDSGVEDEPRDAFDRVRDGVRSITRALPTRRQVSSDRQRRVDVPLGQGDGGDLRPQASFTRGANAVYCTTVAHLVQDHTPNVLAVTQVLIALVDLG